ncbi:Ig-like domain-containing protein [Mucilaginibacter gossypiicola]|uniref:Ig-like domain-containing protein n=1 Tax=Mucilaginibacter gossypiicola TaxID=551995 RepID=A0A1H8EVP1_9SPHI|nr:Ig-like domain-containing protein [Mucilaginibacter gossypiicola]SEN23543.1 Ig-like domain-containing protein [Mucilaginibacter gossypiicola]
MLNTKPAIFYKNSLLIFIVLFIFGCAAQQPPQGGPRDQTPPKLVKAIPGNKTRNFAAKQIDLEFDEFIKLTNTYQEISMSPAMEKQPEYTSNKRKLKIEFKDTLQKNTTYVINFGKAIQDVNESNILKNFTYVFSTGNHIDSLSITGTVTNTLTQEKEKDVLVFIFPVKQDTLFGKKKPSIFALTDSSGNFALNNLREDDYRIYALKEASPDKIFNRDDELIAFLKKPIHLRADTSNIQLNLFKQDPEKFRVSEKRFDTDGKLLLVFNKGLTQPAIKVLYPTDVDSKKQVSFSRTKDTASVYLRNMNFDSLRVAIFDKGKPIDTIYQLKRKNESFTRVLTTSYNIGNDSKLKPGSNLVLTASIPVDNFDQSLITLNEDSVATSDYTIQKDTGNYKLLNLKYRWRETSKYELILNDGALTDIYGDKNKRLSKKFQINKLDNYSQLTVKLTVPDTSKAYVVELLSEDKKLIQSDPITKSTSLVYKGILAAKYYIRIIYDENKNGKWDSGNVKLKRQPENIWLNEKLITLRPNWEAEEPVTIPKEKVTP